MAFVWRFFAHEDEYPDLDGEAACERLAHALSVPTVDGPTPDRTDWAAFDELVEFFRASFPHVFAAGAAERVGHSLMVDVPGSDPSLDPVMLMGHMDVVPQVRGTESDWTHPAFSGATDGTYVWGRGALDMKDQVMGELEAVEYVLAHGRPLRRRVLLCFGQDEETVQSGARSIGRLLEERGVRVEFLVDEGDYEIFDTGELGASGHFGMRVNLAEKGYADVRLTVRSAGGHSSNPFGGTSLATLSEAIARVARDRWPVELVEVDRMMLDALAPLVDEEPLAGLVRGGRAAIDANADEIVRLFLGKRDLFPLVTTTVAPTMIEGGSQQANVMPQDMSATVNFRMLPGVSKADVLGRVRALVSDLPVEVELDEASSNDASRVSRADGYGFGALRSVAARYFRDPELDEPLTLVPSMVVGATDARMYEGVCDSCLRFSAFVADRDEVARGVHGTDERITRRAYLQGVRFLIRLLEETCVEPVAEG
ncbi:MAG: M20/M25/M40 family metallo-hydrolase [Olsenella sp.]|jgi:carboxypeptidase PM20D1